MVLAFDGEEDVVQVPLVVPRRFLALQLVGKRLTKFHRPLPDAFVSDDDCPIGQHFLAVAETQGEPKLKPDGVADDVAAYRLVFFIDAI